MLEGLEGVAVGLVSSKTSDTPSDFQQVSADRIRINPKELRLKAMRRTVGVAADLHVEECSRGGRRWRAAMVTLTYAQGWLFDPRQISEYLKRVRHWLDRRGHSCRYVWVLESTKAGVPHYHVLFWLPVGLRLPMPDKSGWWPWGSSRIEWAKKAVGYLVKYASKLKLGDELPKGARLYGRGGHSPAGRARIAWRRCPGYVRDVWGSEHRPTPALGGGWLSRDTGEVLESPWRRCGRADDWSWIEFELKPGFSL